MLGAANNFRCWSSRRGLPRLPWNTGGRQLLHLRAGAAVDFMRSAEGDRFPAHREARTGSSSDPARTLSILLHADRRPQALPTKDGIRTHFGPSLLGTVSSKLPSLSASELGQGSSGILRLREDKPSSVIQLPIDHHKGLSTDRAFGFLIRMAPLAGLSFPEPLTWEAAQVLQRVWHLFDEYEGLWFNFKLSIDEQVKVLDPHLEFDDYAVHRHPKLREIHEQRTRDPNAAMAEDGGLFYIKLHQGGNVGCFGYGAGNAMATMDGLGLAGGKPANFLDGGGGATKGNARLAVETLNRDPDVKAIFINTFGGITRTDVVAQGIIEAVRENDMKQPIVARMKGTGAEEAKRLLQGSGLRIATYDDFKEAAAHAVRAAQSGTV